MPCFYLTRDKAEPAEIGELRICLAEALYDLKTIMERPVARRSHLQVSYDQIVSNLERAWEITGGAREDLEETLLRIAQAVARRFGRAGEFSINIPDLEVSAAENKAMQARLRAAVRDRT
jgi:hypothetical protein